MQFVSCEFCGKLGRHVAQFQDQSLEQVPVHPGVLHVARNCRGLKGNRGFTVRHDGMHRIRGKGLVETTGTCVARFWSYA
jgi:hypothetical protein